MEANGVNGRTGPAAEVTQDCVWEEWCSIETGAFILAERKDAPLGRDEDEFAQVTAVFP